MQWVLGIGWLIGGCAYGGQTKEADPIKPGQAEAVFAGGCFWCMESDFEKLDGVLRAESGYTGGVLKGPSYKQVGSGATHHLEGVRVVYDPKKLSYETLVQYFFHHIDPTQADGQFCDRGEQYTTAVFAGSKAERELAEAEKKKVAEQLHKPIATTIRERSAFWLAEDYHQDYYRKNPAHYQRYRQGCGRDATVRALWKGSHE